MVIFINNILIELMGHTELMTGGDYNPLFSEGDGRINKILGKKSQHYGGKSERQLELPKIVKGKVLIS